MRFDRTAWTRMFTIVFGTLIAPLAARAEGDARFQVSTLAEGFDQPIALQQAPDGRLFVAEKTGAIKVLNVTSGNVTPWAQLEVFSNGECGLLGLALHPDFAEQPYVYLFATVSNREQQIIRLRDENNVGVEPTVIRGSIPTQGSNHNGGCLRVGPDGYLYFSVGDNGQPDTSQQLTALTGKICRIALDGTVLSTNPFTTVTGAPRAVFALGFRNPFRFCFAPDGRLFVMDVGSSDAGRSEEINQVSAGDNGGWPFYEGIHAEAVALGFINPIYAYHDAGSSIGGCVVYNGSQFPADFEGNLLHLDYTSQGLFRTVLGENGVESHSLLVRGSGGVVDLAQLSDGTLVYSELLTGRLRRVRFLNGEGELVAGEAPAPEQTASPNALLGPACGQGLAPMLALGLPMRRLVRSRRK